jgi:Fe-S oxidoreductase
MLAKSNIEAIDACNYRRIMTTDPHSLNALRNEYAAFGKSYRVHHYTEILDECAEADKLRLKSGRDDVVTYHDPCYLGRYNDGFDAPRRLIARAGYRLLAAAKTRSAAVPAAAGFGGMTPVSSSARAKIGSKRHWFSVT